MSMSDNRTAALWLQIDQLHLKFLQSEDTPAKLELRQKVEGYVAEYLSNVPQARKFVSDSTGDLIANSVKWKPDFSLAKAANAFRAIEQYAANLLNQPWRPEFWTIRQYSGFYKHSVETALFGAERLFQEMGYSAAAGQAQVLTLAPPQTGQHPVRVDSVTGVARDCLLACVECGLLADIQAGVAAQFPGPATQLEEVLQFRKDHIGSVDICVRDMLYRKSQLRFQQFPAATPQYGSFTPGYPGAGGCLVPPAYPAPQLYPAPLPAFPDYHAHQFPASLPAFSPVNGYHGPGGAGGAGLVQLEQGGGGGSPAGSSTSTLRQGQIPSTVLELCQEERSKPPEPPAQPERRHARQEGGERGAAGRSSGRGGRGAGRRSGAEQEDGNWDYVYKHLERTGYTKDQAERPDVLDAGQEEEDLRRNLAGLQIHAETRNGMESVGRVGRGGEQQRQSRVVGTSESSGQEGESKYSSAVSEEREPGRAGAVRAQLWECSTCTFHNKQSKTICEMCSKSRDLPPLSSARPAAVEPARPARALKSASPGPRAEPVEAVETGRVCAKCTFVNPAGARICQVCDCTLDLPPIRPGRQQ